AVQLLEDELGNAVVEDALALDDFVAGAVAGGGVVLEVLEQGAGFRPLVKDLGLAFIDLPATVHISLADLSMFGELRVHAPEQGRNARSLIRRVRKPRQTGGPAAGAADSATACGGEDVDLPALPSYVQTQPRRRAKRGKHVGI